MTWTRSIALLGLLLLPVAACDDDDGGGPTTVDPPAAPTGLTATVENALTVTVSWTAPADADDFRVVLDPADGDPISETTASTSLTFEGLDGRTEFTVSVFASNAGGESEAATTTVTTGSLNESFFTEVGFNNMLTDPGLPGSAFDFGTMAAPPDFIPAAMPGGFQAATLPAPDGSTLFAPVDGRTLEQTSYAGAIEPGTALADAWYFGWTVWTVAGDDSRPGPTESNLPVVDVEDNILQDTRWTSDRIWRLNGPIFVGVDCGPDGDAPQCIEATLTIDPGTTVVGLFDVPEGERGSFLVVNRGSRIVADATPGEPLDSPRRPTAAEVIVFTSEQPRGQRAVEDWGGLILSGRAPLNTGEEAQGEGDSGFYGGDDPNDDSGILRGVRIEYAGDDVNAADQLNGLALQGVGAGTTISYVQIHYNRDDGIEPFGGTVSVDHLVVTGIGDDSVDGTDGYRGFMQFILGQQNGVDADQGFEVSNNGDDPGASPRTTAVLANATMVGAGDNVVSGEIAGAESDNGVQFREGSNYRLYNSIITGFGESGFCIRGGQTIQNALNRLQGETDPTETLSAEGLILFNNQGAGDSPDNFAACGGGSS